MFADQVDEQTTIEWQGDRVVERTDRRLGGVVLESFERRARPGDRVRTLILDRLRREPHHLPWSEPASNLAHRVALMHAVDPQRWPDWSEEGLRDDLSWLESWITGATSLDDVRSVDLVQVLRTTLGHERAAMLDREVPVRLELPSGRTVTVDYSGQRPSVAAKVQEFYGSDVTPTIAGRPVVLELLSPANRPVQVTDDLAGFWGGSWAEVRKELAGRYPKHDWPDDPRSAPARR